MSGAAAVFIPHYLYIPKLSWILMFIPDESCPSESSPRKTKKASSSAAEKPAAPSKHAAGPDRAVSPVVSAGQSKAPESDVCPCGLMLLFVQQEAVSEPGTKERFCAAVQDGHTALGDQRCRNAQQSFSLALRILESSGTAVLTDSLQYNDQ